MEFTPTLGYMYEISRTFIRAASRAVVTIEENRAPEERGESEWDRSSFRMTIARGLEIV